MCQIGYCLSCKSPAIIYGSDVKPSPTSGVLSAPEFDAETARNGSDQKSSNLICAYITDVYNNTDFYDFGEFIDGKRWSTGYVGEDNYITKQIEFIFNGIEFIGDYDFFGE